MHRTFKSGAVSGVSEAQIKRGAALHDAQGEIVPLQVQRLVECREALGLNVGIESSAAHEQLRGFDCLFLVVLVAIGV